VVVSLDDMSYPLKVNIGLDKFGSRLLPAILATKKVSPQMQFLPCPVEMKALIIKLSEGHSNS